MDQQQNRIAEASRELLEALADNTDVGEAVYSLRPGRFEFTRQQTRIRHAIARLQDALGEG